MDRKYVSSSNLHSVGYDNNTHTLEIQFNTGSVYQYSNGPLHIYQGLMNASSHGPYFHQFIRDVYPYRRIH